MPSEARTHSIEAACRERRLPVGRQRAAIIRVLESAHDHPTAEQILERARAIEPRISPATVYRTLVIFEKEGLVFRHDFGDGKTRYEDARIGGHDHLIDAETGDISNFDELDLKCLLGEILAKGGYELVDYRLDVLCRKRAPARWTKSMARRVMRRT